MKLTAAVRLKKWVQITQFLSSLSHYLERVNFSSSFAWAGASIASFQLSPSTAHTSHARIAAYKDFFAFFFLIARAAIWQVVQQQRSPAAAVQGPCARRGEQENVQRV